MANHHHQMQPDVEHLFLLGQDSMERVSQAARWCKQYVSRGVEMACSYFKRDGADEYRIQLKETLSRLDDLEKQVLSLKAEQNCLSLSMLPASRSEPMLDRSTMEVVSAPTCLHCHGLNPGAMIYNSTPRNCLSSKCSANALTPILPNSEIPVPPPLPKTTVDALASKPAMMPENNAASPSILPPPPPPLPPPKQITLNKVVKTKKQEKKREKSVCLVKMASYEQLTVNCTKDSQLASESTGLSITAQDLLRVKLRRPGDRRVNVLKDSMNISQPVVTDVILQQLFLKRSRSNVTLNEIEKENLQMRITTEVLGFKGGLRKTGIKRSPGGTPLFEKKRKRRSSTGQGLTPLMTRALKKKFQSSNLSISSEDTSTSSVDFSSDGGPMSSACASPRTPSSPRL